MAPQPRPAIDRFIEKIEYGDECWRWIGAKSNTGYGNFFDGTAAMGAHRWSYQYHRGAIPKGKHLDHLCRNRWCVNPWHLEPVTPAENVQRGDHTHCGEWQRQRSACPQGHPYDEANTYHHADGRRFCRACNRERMRARRVAA